MFKVMTVVGTRPEIIKLSEVIKELDLRSQHILVHTGQNYDYELNELFFKQLNIRKPDFFLEAASPKDIATDTIGKIISKLGKKIREIKPDAILFYGDTNSCLGVIAAKKNRIPIFHMEAGNRCFDQRVPEEVNRKLVDHLSDINMPLSERARDYLILEGIKPDTIIKTGSPMKEVLASNMKKIKNSKILIKEKLKKNKYFLISIHREENVDSDRNFKCLLDSINAIANIYKMPIIISTHPRTKIKLKKIEHRSKNNLIRFSKPYGFHEYNKLQMNAFCILSDSGTITEESSILNLPAITIRQAHERPEGMDETTIIMSELSPSRVLNAIDLTTKHYKSNSNLKPISDYEVDNVSKKVVRIIYSYTDFVNRTVWNKVT
jgi:UDP-N-acetylglucosamine 2-epimerase (non-hydrolysing)